MRHIWYWLFRLALEGNTDTNDKFDECSEMNEMSAEKRNLLNVYQHCWDDDKVDVDLIAKLVLLIATTTPVSGTFSFPPPHTHI